MKHVVIAERKDKNDDFIISQKSENKKVKYETIEQGLRLLKNSVGDWNGDMI